MPAALRLVDSVTYPRGTVQLASADPTQAPRIVSNYLTDPHDARVLVAGLKMLRGIYRQPSFRDLVTPDDVVLVHDPQPAGLIEQLKGKAAAVVWTRIPHTTPTADRTPARRPCAMPRVIT